MDLAINAPPEIIAAFNSSYARRSRGWTETYCHVCDPEHRKRGRRTLRAGIYCGRPWWGCMRCHCEKDFAAARRTARLRIGDGGTHNDPIVARESAMRIWERTSTIRSGDPSDLYLRLRGLRPLQAWPVDLRYGRTDYYDGEKKIGMFDALIGAVRDSANSLIGVLRIYLMPDGRRVDDASLPRSVQLRVAKKAKGPITGGAVRLGDDAEVIGITEGIESGLGLAMRLGHTCWAAVSANGMKNLVVPKTVKKIIIGPDIGDKNDTGFDAALYLQQRLLLCPPKNHFVEATIMAPPLSEKGDWADWARTQSR